MTGLRRLLRSNSTVRNNQSLALTAENIYRILAPRRRRQLLVIPDEHEGDEVHHGELAERLATQENGTGPDGESAAGYEPVYVALYQSHLPVLEKHGVG